MRVERWDDSKYGDISEDRIRALHEPSGAYRISSYEYAPGTHDTGATTEGRWYVLEGECELAAPTRTILRRGDIATVPEGGFSLVARGTDRLVMIKVWRLPEEFWTDAE